MRFSLQSSLCLVALALVGLCAAEPATAARSKKNQAQGSTYRVKSGDSLARIAKNTGTTVAELQRLNQLSSSALKPGQVLRLEASATKGSVKADSGAKNVTPAVAESTGAPLPSHRVKKGESLYQIARRHKVGVADLQRWNHLSGTALKPGQTLVLAEKAAVSPAMTEVPMGANLPDEALTHTVAKGESLYQIARKNGIPVEELVRLNQLQGHRIDPGQRLLLSAPEPSAQGVARPSTTVAENRGPDFAASSAAAADAAAACPLPAPEEQTGLLATPEVDPEGLARTIGKLRELPYRFGGNGVNGIDCSGFVQRVYREFAINLPRSAREQYRLGSPVERELLQQGDLLFFRTYAKYPSHVGIYLGGNKMVHASTRSRKVVISDITQAYYKKRYIGAKRLVALAPESLEVDSVKGLLQEEADEEAKPSPGSGRKAALPQARAAVRPG